MNILVKLMEEESNKNLSLKPTTTVITTKDKLKATSLTENRGIFDYF